MNTLKNYFSGRLRAYSIALAITLLALLLLTAQKYIMVTKTPFLIFISAVALSSRFGGLGPGLLSVALSVLMYAFYVNPITSASSKTNYELMRIAVFASVAFLIALIINMRNSVEEALRRTRDELELRVKERTAKLSEVNSLLESQISKHEQMEEALRESKALYQTLVERLPVYIFLKDKEGRFIYVNERFRNSLNMSFEDIVGKTDFDLYPSEVAHKYRQDDLKIIQTGEYFEAIEEHYRPDGQKLYVQIIKAPIINSRNEITGLQGIFWDVTERHVAEERFHKQAEETEAARVRLDAILTSVGESIYQLDAEGNLIYLNPAGAKMLGYTLDEIVGQKMHALVHSHSNAIQAHRPESCPLLNVIKKGVPYQTSEDYFLSKTGHLIPVQYTSTPIVLNGQITGAVLSTRDITERKEAEAIRQESEQKLLQSQKMEAIGRLAGGVAHDFNNLLTAIIGYNELMLMKLSRNDPLKHSAEEIKKASGRAAALTQQLLAFSRRQMLQTRVFDLNSIVSDIDPMLRRLIGEDIDFITIQGEDAGAVKADPGQIEQVIMNLVVNARDAMPNGGKLTLETARVELGEDLTDRSSPIIAGQYVMLAVSDNGTGIDEETRLHLFEPFFTTKEKGKGTGLGLSTVYGIVKQSSGHIRVYSEVGSGTTFKVYLPRVNRSLYDLEHDAVELDLPSGVETILLVEDEAVVRTLVREILESYSYQVIEAQNSTEALDICENYKEPIDLLVTDIVMPQMSGPELVKRSTSLRPEMKVLYMSGYTENAIVHHGILTEEIPFLQKPFTPDSLASKVREVLDKED
jgi:two-component system, cell cycle sensor histidine kinase and response regulator CckA